MAVCGLTACQPSSPAYRHIKSLPYTQWEAYAATFPIEQRLDLHKEIRQRSGHNPKMTIEAIFATQPQETYRAIVKRLKSGNQSRFHMGVLYEIDASAGFKICDQPDIKIVQDYLAELSADFPAQPGIGFLDPDFYTC